MIKTKSKITLEVEYEFDSNVLDPMGAEDAIKVYALAEMTMCNELSEKGVNVLNVKIE
jgi:hypothetical protein